MKIKKFCCPIKLLGIVLIAIFIVASSISYIYSKNTIKIGFLGDSITFLGWVEPSGYVRQFVTKSKIFGINIIAVPAGKSADTTDQMLARINNDVLKHKPDVMFIMGGMNDINRNFGDDKTFKNSMNKMVNIAIEDNIEPVILTITVDRENLKSGRNRRVDEYNRYLSNLARKKGIQIIDVNTPLKKEIVKQRKFDNVVTVDGVHLNKKGNTIVANKMLKDFVKRYYATQK